MLRGDANIQQGLQLSVEVKTSICWWNTRLAPYRGEKNNPEHLKYVAQIVKLLTADEIDLFCLGEVDSETMDALSKLSNDNRFVYEERTNKNGDAQFGMGIIYNRERLRIGGSTYGLKPIGQHTRKVCQYFQVGFSDILNLHIFLVHWPSRLRADSVEREKIAVFLRSEIDKVNESGSEKVIVLGDFNDEPYNASLSDTLFATRDLAMAQQNSRLLYNPFWRSLTTGEKYVKNSPATDLTGSYFYRQDKVHRWRVFDQAMFSSSLLGKSNWHLDETRTGIVSRSQLLNIGPNGNDYIDHLPVVAALEGDIDLG